MKQLIWKDYKSDSPIIILIYTKELGLTEYAKRNSEKLRIKNP
ncbi:hypothetical protein [Bernardetia sp. MNP-M8]